MNTYEAALERLRSHLQQSEYAEETDRVINTVVPSIRMRATKVNEDEIPIGSSKLGGMPHVAEDFVWPRDDGQPLMFLAQINLSEIPRERLASDVLPSVGMLYFFYNALEFDTIDRKETGNSFAVRFHEHEGGEPLLRVAAPPPQTDKIDERDLTTLKSNAPCRVEFSSLPSIPSDVMVDVEHRPNMEFEEFEARMEFEIGLDSAIRGDLVSHHTLLGHPQTVQDWLPYEVCQLHHMVFQEGWTQWDPTTREGAFDRDAVLEASQDWILLAQLDSDDEPGWDWVDLGRLYFCIRKQDLELRRFDLVRGELQTT